MEGHLPQHLHQFLDFVLPRERRYLGAILLVSLLGHLFCFVLFKVRVEPPMRPPRPPMQVTLASMPPVVSEIQEASVSLLDIRNPSVFAVPPLLPGEEKRMMGVPEIYAPPLDLMAGSKMPAGMGLSASLDAVEARAIRSIEALKPSAMPIAIETPPPLSGSSFLLTGPVSERRVVRKPDLPKPETKSIDLGCTVIQILVNQNGLVEFADIEESCRDSSIDQMGMNAARALVFTPTVKTEASLQQGRLTIYWDFVEKSAPLEISAPPPAPAVPPSGAKP